MAQRAAGAPGTGAATAEVPLAASTAPAGDGKDKDGWVMTLAPQDNLYPQYLADPHRTTFRLAWMHFLDSDIPGVGDDRFGVSMGGRFGVFRFHPEDDPDSGLQLNIDAGFIGEFDIDSSADALGWNGIFALLFTYQGEGRLQYKFGAHHTSSHLGDEYQENTGRQRIDYGRDELQFGVSVPLTPHWLVYGEAGYAIHRANRVIQEHGRVQTGIQYESPGRYTRHEFGVYAAADFSAYEETDWSVNTTLQGGWLLRTDERTWRLGIELYDGRSIISEFFQDDEQHIAIGLWLDL